MQVSEFLEHQDFVPILICVYLISILARRLFRGLSNVLRYSEICERAKSRFERTARDRRDFCRIPGDTQGGENQFLARTGIVNECNYADSVPFLEPQSAISRYLRGIVKQEVRCFLTKASRNPLKISDASGSIRRNTSETSVETETSMESLTTKSSDDDSQLRTNLENVTERQARDSFLQKDVKTPIPGEVKLKEDPETLSSDAIEFEKKFSNDRVPLYKTQNDSRDEHVKYSTNSLDRRNEVDILSNVVDYSPHKYEANLEIGRGNASENSAEYSVKKIEERPETGASCSPDENFSASVLQQSNRSEANCSTEKIITLDSSGITEAVRNVEEEKQKNWKAQFPDDECHSKMDLAGFPERLSFLKKDTEICSRRGEDHLYEQFGVFPEKGTNCTEVKSIMHSSKNATQSREEEEEGRKEFGYGPEANSLKNDREVESTISLARASIASYGKEEEALNAMIRRMLITELKRCRKKEEATLKRAHSDTESVLPTKRSNIRNRAALFNVKGQTFFRGLSERDENPLKVKENRSDNESTETEHARKIVSRYSSNPNANDLKNCSIIVSVVGSKNSKRSAGSLENSTVSSDILLERKVKAPHMIDAETEKLFGMGKALETRKHKYTSKSTQTEHVYVIHAVRSCPVRKRRLPLQLQLHRVALGHSAVCSKTVYANQDFSRFIFRKASDNLIYEKGKGSSSPSCVAATERFRWRYVTPKNVK